VCTGAVRRAVLQHAIDAAGNDTTSRHCLAVRRVLILTLLSFDQRATLLKDLLSVTEPNLLVNTIWATKALITYAIMQQVDVPHRAEILEAAEGLMMHPVQQIADLACSLEDLLSSYDTGMDSDEEY
jgi:hypothetical protein